MLDPKFVRENSDLVSRKAKEKGVDIDINHILEIDQEFRKLFGSVQILREKRNKAAKERNVEEGRKIKESLEKEEHRLSGLETELKDWLQKIPNPALDGVPIGDESKNQVIKKEGEPAKFDFQPKDHLEIGENLDILDVSRAAKVSGSRFGYLKNDGALLEVALIRFAFDRLVKEGFKPLIPPVLIKQGITEGLGYWQAGGNENYYQVSDFDIDSGSKEDNPLYLIGTAEHAVVPMHQDETLSELPKKYAAFSSSFRREAGSYGKDVRGIMRVHQFDKVEMVALVKPEDDEKERKNLLSLAEGFVKELELPYQLVKLASGDLPFPTAETIDIEIWLPSQNKYRETHSISTTTDFQARRFGIRYQEGSEKKFVHILNGTAFAIGRTIIAILESHQQKDGSVKLPKVLHDYMGKDTLQRKK